MDDRSREWLNQIVYSVRYIQQRIATRSLEDFLIDEDLRSIVERKIEIIGENVVRLRDNDPRVVLEITDFQRIIGLRNVIAHAYGSLNHAQMWEAVQYSLPALLTDAERLLSGDAVT